MSGIFHNLLSAGGPLVFITDQNINDNLNLGAVYRLQSSGQAQYFTEFLGSYQNIPGEWRLSGATSDYEIRYTLNSGDAPTIVSIPTLSSGVWSSFNSGAQFAIGTNQATNFTIDLRLASTGQVLDTALIIMDCKP